MKRYVYLDAYHRQKKMPLLGWLGLLRGKKGVFLLSFFVAMCLAKIFWREDMNQMRQWSYHCIKQMDIEKIDQQALFFYVLMHRGQLLLLLLLSGLTRFQKLLYQGCTVLAGGMFGMICLSFIQSFGAKGIFIYFLGLLPQWVIYFILFAYLQWFFRSANTEKTKRITKLLYLLGIAALFIIGVYLECFVNPILLQWCEILLV